MYIVQFMYIVQYADMHTQVHEYVHVLRYICVHFTEQCTLFVDVQEHNIIMYTYFIFFAQ